jgi:hypothetical protein
MSGVMPRGHSGTLIPQRMYFIDQAHAVFDGTDLGNATTRLRAESPPERLQTVRDDLPPCPASTPVSDDEACLSQDPRVM